MDDADIEVLHARGRAYLAGPMRGIVEYNFPAFHVAAAHLRDLGYTVWSPAERDEQEDGFDPKVDEAKPMLHYMRHDLPAVLNSDLVVVLPGWQKSTGARLEVYVAEKCGIPVFRYPDMAPARHPSSRRFHAIIDEWGALHDRKQADYGTDSDPFANVRASEDFSVPGWVGGMIRANDKMKRLQTFARKGSLENEPVVDSFDDLGVYSAICRVLYEENDRRPL